MNRLIKEANKIKQYTELFALLYSSEGRAILRLLEAFLRGAKAGFKGNWNDWECILADKTSQYYADLAEKYRIKGREL